MSGTKISPQNLPETLVWYYIIGTYVIYYIGGQYLFAPLLGLFLVIYLLRQRWKQTENTPDREKISISLSAWIWLIGMLVIELALIIGHLNFQYDVAQIIKSTTNRWLRSWFLFALFPLAGHLNIRPQLVYRAVCILCCQSLIFIFIAILAIKLDFPADLVYESPLKIFGGGEFYQVFALGYVFDQGTEARLTLFTPWAPALGLVGNVYFFLACEESDKRWRILGIIGSIAMIVSSVSRLGLFCFPIVASIVWLLSNYRNPLVYLGLALFSFFSSIFGITLIETLENVRNELDRYRSSSSKVRAVLRRMAFNASAEAPIWGHGTIEGKGPPVAGRMPIGTHHTWFSLLYTHGLVGFVAFGFPLVWSVFDLTIKAQKIQTAKVGLSIVLVLILFSIGENLDSLTYIYWPGLLILGIAFREDLYISAYLKQQL